MRVSKEAGDKGIARILAPDDLLVRLGWKEWLSIEAPYKDSPYRIREVTTRYRRNGFTWDMHGRLYLPNKERAGNYGFFLIHGGAGSEMEMHETPDGRPGLAAVLAQQGYRCLSVTFTGHYPPGGEWQVPVGKRQPHYLLDRDLPIAEIHRRNLVCTFDTVVQGAARLVDRHMADCKVLAFGHSTGGPMAVALPRFLKRAEVAGIVGWASGGPDGWYEEWCKWVSGRSSAKPRPLRSMARRSVESFRKAGYEDMAELCPWGGAEGYIAWGNRFKSQMKTSLCDNQHGAHVEALREYARLTGLPESEYLGHLLDPDPAWLSRVGVLLLTGENDKNHWLTGATEKQKLETFMGEKFERRAARTRVVLVPKYGHFGFAGLHNEKIAYVWLHALKSGYFRAARHR